MSAWASGRPRLPLMEATSVSSPADRLSSTRSCAKLHTVGSNIGTTDKKCPFTGQISIRGRILTGTVISTKMHRTLIIRREYLHFIPKYSRYEKRHTNLAAHVSPAFRVEEGDQVTVGQCRPLSKTVSDAIRNVKIKILTGDYRSVSTFCACFPEPARLSRLSQSSRWRCDDDGE